MRRQNNYVFLVLLLGVFLWGGITFVKEETLLSKTENRNLNTFSHFTLDSFLGGSFQEGFESAISDQFVASEQIKSFYKQTIMSLASFGIKDSICQNRYLELQTTSQESRRGVFDCEDYLVYLPSKLSEETKEIVSENIEKYNHLNEIADVYYYWIDDPSTFDFSTNERVVDYYGELEKRMKGEKGLKKLEWNSFDEYKQLFYKNDHHWNYKGSYQGYLDIVDMLNIDDCLNPEAIISNHEDFYGAYSRYTSNYDFHDEFLYYSFKFPTHTTLINKRPQKYNHYDEYEKHEYQYEKTENYYAYVYGDDYAEIVFNYEKPKKKNLLIISNSYSNPINELIAAHYNKTFVVDLRHYKEDMGEDFRPKNYIKENDIDEVLVIMSPTFIRYKESNRGLEL